MAKYKTEEKVDGVIYQLKDSEAFTGKNVKRSTKIPDGTDLFTLGIGNKNSMSEED